MNISMQLYTLDTHNLTYCWSNFIRFDSFKTNCALRWWNRLLVSVISCLIDGNTFDIDKLTAIVKIYAKAFCVCPNQINPSSIGSSTTGLCLFAVCQGHTAKAGLHSAKCLPSVTHGKQLTANNGRQRASLPCATSRAHGKHFAVCIIGPTAK